MTGVRSRRTGGAKERWLSAVGSVGGVAAAAALTAVVSLGYRAAPYHGAVRACCAYTPARLAAGEWWTVPASALLVVRLNPFGINGALLLGVVLPYAWRWGSPRALAVFFAGHVAATLAVAAVVLPLAAAGWAPAVAQRHELDVGVSAGIAAVAAAVAATMRRRRLGVALLVALAGFFAAHLVAAHTLSEAEHLIAVATGAVLGRRLAGSHTTAGTGGDALHRRFMASPAG
jgi:hypothetical protein